MDLNDLAYQQEPSWLVLLNPKTQLPLTNDTGQECRIAVVGLDSDQARQAERDITNRRLKRAFQKKRTGTVTAEELEQEEYERVVGCIHGWEGLTLDGQPFEFTKKNAMKLITEWPWIYAQVRDFINDEENFLKAS